VISPRARAYHSPSVSPDAAPGPPRPRGLHLGWSLPQQVPPLHQCRVLGPVPHSGPSWRQTGRGCVRSAWRNKLPSALLWQGMMATPRVSKGDKQDSRDSRQHNTTMTYTKFRYKSLTESEEGDYLASCGSTTADQELRYDSLTSLTRVQNRSAPYSQHKKKTQSALAHKRVIPVTQI